MSSLISVTLLLLAGVSPEFLKLNLEGVERTAVIYANPEIRHENGAPLVLAFHGHGGNAKRQAERLAIHEAWPEAIVVYPQGESGIRGRTDLRGVRSGWQMRPGQAGDRDLKFVDALLDEISRRYAVDPTRVYTVGHSNGGRFAAVLWVARPDKFAAFASACGQGGTLINQARPKPVMMIMGERDRLVPIRSQRTSIELARKLLGTDEANASHDGYLTVERGPEGLELVTYIHPRGHSWPNDANPHIVDFFQRHRLESRAGDEGGEAVR